MSYVAPNYSKVIILCLLGKSNVDLFIANYADLKWAASRKQAKLLFYAIIFQNKFVIMHKLWHNL